MALKLKRFPSWRRFADEALSFTRGPERRRRAMAGPRVGDGFRPEGDEMEWSWRFFRMWLTRPTEIGSPWPSAPSLTRKMAAAATEHPETARVIELGGGTGRITASLLEYGIKPENLTVVEFNPKLAARLRHRFPGVSVLEGDAQTLRGLLGIDPAAPLADLPGGGWDAVVSGLPLVSMPAQVRENIVDAAFSVLAPHGRFVQFTYMVRCPIRPPQRRRLGASLRLAGFTWTNFPPARVFVLERHGAGKG